MTGRHRKTATRVGIAGGALLMLAGLGITAGITLNGGPAGATTQLPASCPPTAAAVTSAMASAATTQVRRASVATPAVSGTVTPLPGAARGIDISSHNAEPNWATLKQGGVSFVGIKATEGDYYVNTGAAATSTTPAVPPYTTEVTDATKAGMYVMPYAFGNPHTGNGDGTCQADFAWQEISSVASPAYSSSSLMLPVVLDIEQDPYASSTVNSCYNQTPSGMVTWIQQFLTEIKAKSGKTPILYTNPSFWSTCTGNSTAFSSYLLWLADYGIASPPAVAGWSSPAMWQYTDQGTVTGETGAVDEDYLTPLQQGSAVGKAVTPVQVRTLGTLNLPANTTQTVAWSASGLPSGLQINATTGVISGTPTAAGSSTVTVTATLSGGTSSSVSFGWNVAPGAITITAPASQSTVLGSPASLQVNATDSNPNASGLTYSATSLPPGMSIGSTTGLISGWPSAPGSYGVQVTATDGQGDTASTSFTWTIGAAANTGTVGAIRQNGGSSKCLDDPGSRTANSSVIDLASCTGASNQSWTAVQDGSIRLLGHCLGASGTRVYLYTCNSTAGEQWQAGTNGAIVSVRYGTCLTGPTGAVANGTVPTLTACTGSTTSAAQHWTRPVAPIVSGVAARCLNASGTAAVTIYNCGNYSSEHWTLQPSGALAVQSTGKCLTEHTTAGSALVQYSCVRGSANQQWTLVAAGAIAVELENPQSGLCVTVPSASSGNGTPPVLGACSTALTSTWRVA